MILSNTSKLLKKLQDPEPIINIGYWMELKLLVTSELTGRKKYHAERAFQLKPVLADGEDLPTEEESKQYKTYQHHIRSANLFHATVLFIEAITKGLKEINEYYQIEKHRGNIKQSDNVMLMISDINKLYKEVDFWQRNWKSEAALYQDLLHLFISQTQQIKAQPHDS